MTPRDAQSGATLVEVLIVLAIVAVMAGVSLLSLGGAGRGTAAEFAAEAMASHLDAAVTASLSSGAVQNVTWDENGYRISSNGEISRQEEMPSGLRLSGERGTLQINPDAAGSSANWRIIGASVPWQVTFDGLNASATLDDG